MTCEKCGQTWPCTAAARPGHRPGESAEGEAKRFQRFKKALFMELEDRGEQHLDWYFKHRDLFLDALEAAWDETFRP